MSVLRSTCVLGRLGGTAFRSQALTIPYTQIRCITIKATTAVQPKESLGHDERNTLAGRPLSPHLTIYAPQLTSMMSISHRISGMMLAGFSALLATASFCSYDMAYIAQWIHDHIPVVLLFPAKAALGFPAAYHFCNGIRHLVWDSGKALTLKDVYMGGYFTLGASALLFLYMLL